MNGWPSAPARYYFSLRSPYPWLAHCDLERDHPQALAAVEWHPFWEPGPDLLRRLEVAGGRFLYAPMTRAKHLYILSDVRRLARERGLAVSWPLDRSCAWDVPHVGYLAAVERGLGRQYVSRLFRARWQEGHDICDPRVVGELMGDPDLVVQALADESVRAQAVGELLQMWDDSVFGVPFFRVGRESFWGLDRLRPFVDALGGAPQVGQPAPVGARDARDSLHTEVADHGHAGGCG